MKYLWIVVIATATYIFFLGFVQNSVKIMEKITVLILVLFTIFLFGLPYVTMSNVTLNLV